MLSFIWKNNIANDSHRQQIKDPSTRKIPISAHLSECAAKGIKLWQFNRIICLLSDYGGCHGTWCPIWCKIWSFGVKTLKNDNFRYISYPNVHYYHNRHQTMDMQ